MIVARQKLVSVVKCVSFLAVVDVAFVPLIAVIRANVKIVRSSFLGKREF